MAETGFKDEDIVKEESPLGKIAEAADFRVMKKLDELAPNRARRGVFVFGSWGAAFCATVGLSVVGGDGAIAKAAVDGFTSYMMTIAMAYIVGYSVDNADFVNKAKGMLRRRFDTEGEG